MISDQHPDAHEFDGEPATRLPPDEPPSPAWLPVVGLVLLGVALVAALLLGTTTPPAPGSNDDTAPRVAGATPK